MASISVFDSPQVAGEGTASIQRTGSTAGAHSATHDGPWTAADPGRTDKIVGHFDPGTPPTLEAEWAGSTRVRWMAACVVGMAGASPRPVRRIEVEPENRRRLPRQDARATIERLP
jgi:hypothetical protein